MNELKLSISFIILYFFYLYRYRKGVFDHHNTKNPDLWVYSSERPF